MGVLEDFWAKQDEATKSQAAESSRSAPSENLRSGPIDKPGVYLCEVAAFAWRDKTSGDVKMSPTLYEGSKGSLNLRISLRVVDGTPLVPKGSSILKNITLMPGAVNGVAPTKDNIDKVLRFTKPLLVTLTGTSNVTICKEWINEWLTADFTEDGKKFVLARDHKMKERVLVQVDHELGSDQVIRLSVKSIAKAAPGSKSETFASAAAPVTAKTTPPPAFDNMMETAEGEVPPMVPEVEEFQ